MEIKKYDEALIQLKLLLTYARNRFEVHECLVHAYIGMGRHNEASRKAHEVIINFGRFPRTLVVNITFIKQLFLGDKKKLT